MLDYKSFDIFFQVNEIFSRHASLSQQVFLIIPLLCSRLFKDEENDYARKVVLSNHM